MDQLQVTEWAFEGVLDEMEVIHDAMKDRQYAFILGAGASSRFDQTAHPLY